MQRFKVGEQVKFNGKIRTIYALAGMDWKDEDCVGSPTAKPSKDMVKVPHYVLCKAGSTTIGQNGSYVQESKLKKVGV